MNQSNSAAIIGCAVIIWDVPRSCRKVVSFCCPLRIGIFNSVEALLEMLLIQSGKLEQQERIHSLVVACVLFLSAVA